MLASELECNSIAMPGPTDEGRGIVSSLLSAAAIAAAAASTAQAVKIALEEYEIAKKYWQIAEDWLDVYRDMYAPVEDIEVKEAQELEPNDAFYTTARGRARVIAWLNFRGLVDKTVRCTSRYCVGLREDMLTDLSIAQADAVALADGLGYRNERAYIESRDDRRFEKKFNTAKRGRDMVASNVSLARSSADIYGSLYDQAWQGLVGAGQYLGYARNRVSIPRALPVSGDQRSPFFVGPPSWLQATDPSVMEFD